ncbi:MAG: hypothetical protein COW00_02475 [Bdellovibrio sp. CG12_big_fil_rev_8_21_14_0_65_39_13]|nr:MAG: hypothetical protein COW78_15695 [Bdellovibrio sp. CG22_combo_CG10-13_8_21_14_all_39_27]PIQ62058.1 MAG: hypothetical protein COW00_02475 [Bdellovibrio sp. CG12_big_fil_rev_8_21_14_0_65_39_13]PIR33882.1 MAG: hypothetical protein COV37_14905 [Bdellovibrio sp. CG11_big_fil_rev_8_21_14_0_20_39_38]
MTKNNRLNTTYFFIIFLIVLGMNLYIFTPLFHALAFAAILAGTFHPMHKRIVTKLKGNREWASALSCVVVFLVFVLPCVYLVFQLSQETLQLYGAIREGLSETGVRDFFFGEGWGAIVLNKVISLLHLDMSVEQLFQMGLVKLQSYSGLFISKLNGVLGDVISFLYQFIVMMLALYALFLEGPQLKNYIFKLSPLPNEQEQALLDKFNQMNFVTMVGNGVGGLIQGVLAGIAFWIAGFPSVVLWSTIMVLLAFIPLVGISIITIPAGIYLILKGQMAAGILLIVWCGIVGLVVENIFKPKFIGSKVKVNGLVLLFYILAGMGAYGMLGIFYGPLLCVIFLTIGELFVNYYLPKLSEKEA